MKKSLLKLFLGIITIMMGFNSYGQCPPTITCPINITVNNDSASCGAVVNFTAPVGVDTCANGSQTFSYTGAMQTFTVPAGVTSVSIDAYGAQGGFRTTIAGGQGGYATGALVVTPGQVLNIYVGGQGTTGPGGQNCNLAGGFNGGGNTGDTCCSNAGAGAGAGGGASDVRAGGTTLNDRVIVAGAGGGAGSGQIGANGGGLTGNNGGTYNGITAGGGSQVAGGIAGGHYSSHACSWGTPGVLGQGGIGDGNDGGGGGGGYYGGGGGANNGGGAGGSSYIGGVTSGTTTSGGRTGDGEVTITYTGAAVPTIQSAGLVSGSTFPVGTTTNTFVSTNAFGTDSCSFTVTVVDVETPTITCDTNRTSCDSIVNGIAPISTADNCPGETVTYMLSGATTGNGSTDASGTTFNLGTTTIWYYVADGAGNEDSCSFDVTVISCVGINENASLNGVSIYPNPTSGLFTINLGIHTGAVNYSISTIEGRIVSSQQGVNTNNIAIDISNESKGIYILKIEDATSAKTYKIIKE